MEVSMKSIRELTGNIVNSDLVESFQFVEGEFSFDELKALLGKSIFANFLLNHLKENGVQIQTVLKEGREVIKPLKTTNNKIIKFWCDSDGQLVDVSIFQPKSLF